MRRRRSFILQRGGGPKMTVKSRKETNMNLPDMNSAPLCLHYDPTYIQACMGVGDVWGWSESYCVLPWSEPKIGAKEGANGAGRSRPSMLLARHLAYVHGTSIRNIRIFKIEKATAE